MYYLPVFSPVTTHYQLYSPWITIIQELLIKNVLTIKSYMKINVILTPYSEYATW